MTDSKISPRDLKALSAYLDGELNAKERQHLETRLEQRPELRANLEELRSTRAVLRNAPVLRAPRNFTLTPQMAGMRTGGRAPAGPYPLLRLTSALAAIFLVLAVVGEWYASSLGPLVMPVAQEVHVVMVQKGTGEDAPRLAVEQVPPGRQVFPGRCFVHQNQPIDDHRQHCKGESGEWRIAKHSQSAIFGRFVHYALLHLDCVSFP